MATTAPHGQSDRKLRFSEDRYPFWKGNFDPEERRQMIEDDLTAGQSVSLVLIALITVGMLLAAITVLCTL